jgi:hypothetical protein
MQNAAWPWEWQVRSPERGIRRSAKTEAFYFAATLGTHSSTRPLSVNTGRVSSPQRLLQRVWCRSVGSITITNDLTIPIRPSGGRKGATEARIGMPYVVQPFRNRRAQPTSRHTMPGPSNWTSCSRFKGDIAQLLYVHVGFMLARKTATTTGQRRLRPTGDRRGPNGRRFATRRAIGWGPPRTPSQVAPARSPS